MADNIFTKFMSFINRIIDPPDDDEEDIDEDTKVQGSVPEPKYTPSQKEPLIKKVNKQANMQFNFGKGDLNVHLVKDIKYPKSATEAVDKIKNHMIVVFNFEDTDQDISQKTIDFISGAAYAIGGDVQMITEYVVLFLPLSGKFSQEQKKRLEDSGFSTF
jgi:cell division inhibitor SepF